MRRAGSILVAVLIAVALPFVTPASSAAAATATVTCDEVGAAEPRPEVALDGYTAINPLRLVDTRNGTGGAVGALDGGCTLRLDLAGSPVPADASAVALSLTAVAERRGFFTVFPCAAGRPPTSNLNSRAGVATPNLVVALLDSRREVCVFTNQGGHLVIDLGGWYGPGGDRFSSIEPVRAYDTRELPGGARLPAGSVRNISIGGAFVPDDATAAVINLTVTDATGRGYLVAYPCGGVTPLASNLNFIAGESRAVAAVAGLGAGGQLCVQSNVDVHVVVDVGGYYSPPPPFGPTASLRPSVGQRLADSRDGTGGWSAPFSAAEVRALDPVALAAAAPESSAVLLNVVATNGQRRGNVRVFPCADDVPLVSNLNFSTEGSVTNLVPVELSGDRTVCFYASAETDVVVDLFGVMSAPTGSLAERIDFGDTDVWPPYDVDGTDYAIVCNDGPTSVDLTLELLPSVTARVNGVATLGGSIDLRLLADELVTLRLQRPGQTRTYYFRCLPSDFPRLDVQRPGSPAPGWYLTTFGQGDSPSGNYLVILDHRGAPVWYKSQERDVLDLRRRSDGTIGVMELAQFYGTADDDVAHRVYDLDGNLLARQQTDDQAAYPTDHHDHVELPGGGWALLTMPLRTEPDDSPSLVDLTPLGSGYFADECVVDAGIREVDADGDLVWSFTTVGNFAVEETTYPQRFAKYDCGTHGGDVDLIHVNSLERIDDGSGDYLVSARHLDAVFRVDRDGSSGREVEWVLGGAAGVANAGGAPRLTIVGDPLGGPLRQHDARMSGDVVTLFDNGTDVAGRPARVVAYEVDAAAGTATMLWQLLEPAGRTSPSQGSARVTPDGSVLVAWGGLQPMFEELDAEGNRLLAVGQLPFGRSYRIVKYPSSAFSVAELRATAGGAAEAP